MQFFTEGYLRVTSPQTIDGSRPKYDEDGRIMTKETELPLSAKKHMEKQNKNLPDHLKKKIEVIPGDQVKVIQSIASTTTPPDGNKIIEMDGRKRFRSVGTQNLKKW